jgi:molybdopterin/thiamine biosynthesis adenylyltransferase
MNSEIRNFIEDAKFNVPFGYLHPKTNKFHAFVNIFFDEENECVYSINGNKQSIAKKIMKEKGVSQEEWLNHVVFINRYGKPIQLIRNNAKKNPCTR